MRAIVLDSYGGPEVLRVRNDVPVPKPGPDEALVKVSRAGVNRADLLQREGKYPQPGGPLSHEIPGLEFSGRVQQVGQRVTSWSEGDEVMAIVAGGGYAEYVAVHERQLMHVPRGVSLCDAAAIPEVFITAWDALVVRGDLRSGGTALIHAGASGVGTAAIQLARALGASAVATVSAGKMPACVALGARAAFDRESEWQKEIRDVDVVLDVVGGTYTRRNLTVLRSGGTIVQVGAMEQSNPELPLHTVIGKRVTLMGTSLRWRPIEEKIALTQRFIREVLPLFEAGMLRPVIDTTFELSEAAQAHGYVADNRNVGKVLLDVTT